VNNEHSEQKDKPGTSHRNESKNNNNKKYFRRNKQTDKKNQVVMNNKDKKQGNPGQQGQIRKQTKHQNVNRNKKKGILISVVIPLLDEEESLPNFHCNLKRN
jgi:hypothetical protein